MGDEGNVPGQSFAIDLVQESADALIALSPAGTVLFWSRGAQSMFGYTPHEVVGRALDEIVVAADRRDEARAMLDGALRTGSTRFETVGWRKDGSAVDIDVSMRAVADPGGAVRFVAASAKDVTQLRRLREERALEARFRWLLEAAPDAMVIVDDAGLIVLVNHQTERLFGYTRDELLGVPVETLVPERYRGQRPADRGGFTAVPTGEGADLWALRRDGSEFAAEISLSPIETADGTLVTAAIRDISPRKQMEERMQQANRLKSEFLANMSHELRTPLNAIIGFAEIMVDGRVEPTATQKKDFLGHILASGRHLLSLVNDILDLSKIEAGKMEFRPESVDLVRVIGEIIAMLRAVASRKRIRVEMEVDPEVRQSVLDPARFKQVLYNYLSNALKFTPDGGRVDIRALVETADTFRLEVSDTGPGIRSGDLARLFIEFQQLDAALTKKHPGTGLGLALTKRIADAQGGSVGVHSVQGKGSVFHAILPRHAPVAVQPPSGADVADHRPGVPAVLVIEDDSHDLSQLVRALTGAGYAVDSATNGRMGLAKFEAQHFDAVLLDLLLPDMNGLDVLHQIRSGAKAPDTPVIIVTVVADNAAGFPVQEVLTKPIDVPAVLAALRRAGVAVEHAGSVLVVDDDPTLLGLMAATLDRLGYTSTCQPDAAAALHAAEKDRPLAVILDLAMPGMSGFEFLERFRSEPTNRDVPVLIWTARDLTAGEEARLREQTQAIHSKVKGGVADLLQDIERILPRQLPAQGRS